MAEQFVGDYIRAQSAKGLAASIAAAEVRKFVNNGKASSLTIAVAKANDERPPTTIREVIQRSRGRRPYVD